jgi:methylthioribose-1-phosphate isomerase
MNLIQPANQNEVFVVAFNGNNKVPKNYAALNYLHDITPSSFVTYYANENGLYKDFKKLLADLKKESSRSIKQRVAT